MKIADFGLARDVHNIDYYKKTTNVSRHYYQSQNTWRIELLGGIGLKHSGCGYAMYFKCQACGCWILCVLSLGTFDGAFMSNLS